MDSVTPDAINKFCADKAVFESLLFSVISVFVLIIVVEFVVIVTVCRRRKKSVRQYSRSKNKSEQTFHYFVTAYVYQMKKEGHLKDHVQQFSTVEVKRALTDKQCINKIDQIKTHITKYFVIPIDECLIESPYYGFNTKSKHFSVEEKVKINHHQIITGLIADVSVPFRNTDKQKVVMYLTCRTPEVAVTKHSISKSQQL